jgi:hypothetical protein
MMLPKVLRTQVHMSSRISVNHWHFEHYLQSLCLPVLHPARNLTKIVPWSFPMSLFLGSTVWSSLLILRISWHAAAAALNSWPSRLWSRNSSPPSSRSPHYVRLENQVIWLWKFVRQDLFHYCPVLDGTKLTNHILAEMEKSRKSKTLGVTRFQESDVPHTWVFFFFHHRLKWQYRFSGTRDITDDFWRSDTGWECLGILEHWHVTMSHQDKSTHPAVSVSAAHHSDVSTWFCELPLRCLLLIDWPAFWSRILVFHSREFVLMELTDKLPRYHVT